MLRKKTVFRFSINLQIDPAVLMSYHKLNEGDKRNVSAEDNTSCMHFASHNT